MRFKHLTIPDGWETYWTKYPQGMTILESLFQWVNQVDNMVDNQNSLAVQVENFRTELDTFVGQFGEDLQKEVSLLLNEWQESGFLEVVISEAIEHKVFEVEKQVEDMRVSVKDFGAKGDGVTDDTKAIQDALDYVALQYRGEVAQESGYIRFSYPVLFFPDGIYRTGKVTPPRRIHLKADGRAVIQSLTGTKDAFDGFFMDAITTHVLIEGLTFLFQDTVFRLQTNNADQSFITFRNCTFAKVNLFIDMVSYSASRSTIFNMVGCNASYGVKTIAKLYADKANFKDNWFNHSEDSILIYVDSLARFENNIYVPTRPGINKAWIEFSGTDHARALSFENERFSGEGGSCPIVVVRDVNMGNTTGAYRNQGITFSNCQINVINPYNPSEIAGGAVRYPIILRPATIPNKTINFIKFIGCTFSPDLSAGMVGAYAVDNIDNYLPADFSIEFDYTSATAATRGANKLLPTHMMKYAVLPLLKRQTNGMTSTGKVGVVATATAGTKKATFQVKRNNGTYQPPMIYRVVLVGQGDSRYNSNSYVCTSVYYVDMSGVNLTATNSQLNFTKQHSSKGGAGEGANADIISVHFGTDDTGSNQKAVGGNTDEWADVTIVFGTNIALGSAYVQPLMDFTLGS